MRLRLIFPAALLALPLSSFAQLGFGLSGFTSGYGNGDVTAYQTYMVLPAGTMPHNYNGPWTSVAPTLNGVQVPYMLVNGGAPTTALWSETLNVAAPNETFTYSGTSVYSGDTGPSAATIQLTVNGMSVGGLNTLDFNSATPGGLVTDTIQLGALAPGSYTFALYDTNGGSSGNDFALAGAVPEPSAFAVLGIGLIPLLRRRKR